MRESVGWIDEDADPSPPRVAGGVSGVPAGTPLAFQVTGASAGRDADLVERLRPDWLACGVGVEVELQDAATLMAPWPDGPAFSRAYEALVWSWLTSISPPCEMFASWGIASDDVPFGSNARGFRRPEYDHAR